MDTIYGLAVLIASGLIFSKILGKFKFPDVTGYLIGGIIIGPSVLGLLTHDIVKSMEILSTVALSFIAFSIGSEMDLKAIKKMGSKIITVTIFEALGAFVIVTMAMLLIFKQSVAFSIAIGSIACATAPAATLMVIRQYNAKGPLVDVLIPVVALDDAICIIAFGICSFISNALINGESLNFITMIGKPLLEIILSFLLGGVSGFIYSLLAKYVRNDAENISFTLAMIFIVTWLSIKFNLSGLLTLMVMGVVITNVGHVNKRYQTLVNNITPPIFVCFFVLSGADLDLANLKAVGLIGIGYVIARVVGKYLGAMLSTKMVGLENSVQKNLGLTLIPQAGVALGLSLLAANIIHGEHGQQIRTIVLGATIVYELIGPLVAKFALKRADCIAKNA